ncbi:hypothetical protein F4859DRAFT_476422 [Xylaria cf. heliscus]|nr:hypothetical protein F4859DRAFT_476422 [Xylaria cf. heliscus]
MGRCGIRLIKSSEVTVQSITYVFVALLGGTLGLGSRPYLHLHAALPSGRHRVWTLPTLTIVVLYYLPRRHSSESIPRHRTGSRTVAWGFELPIPGHLVAYLVQIAIGRHRLHPSF